MSDTVTVNLGGDDVSVTYGENAAEATRQALIAQAAAEEAQASADASDASANLSEAAALTNGNVYATKAAGVAAVAEGETFWSDEDYPLALYRRTAGVAVFLDEFVAQSSIDHFFTYQATLTVGTDQPTLMDALNVLDERLMRLPVTLQLPAAQETSAVTIDIAGLTLRNPRMDQVTIQGAAGSTPLANASTMTGVESTDLNAMRAAMTTVILIDGDDSVASGTNLAAGLESLSGLSFKDLGIHDRARYGVASGYNRTHASAGVGGRLRLENVVALGAVWSFFTYAGTIVMNGTNLIGRAKNGGAMGIYHGRLEMPTGTHTFYAPDVTTTSDGPKYMINMTGPAAYCEVGSGTTVNFDGRSLYGFFMQGGAKAMIYGTLNVDKVSCPITLNTGSEMSLSQSLPITNCDPTKTSLIGSATQDFEPGNGPTNGALIHVGSGCTLRHNGVTMSNVDGVNALRIMGGQMHSYNRIDVTNYAFSSYFATIWGRGSTGTMRASSPKGTNSAFGSQIIVPVAGEIALREDPTAHGLTTSPAADTGVAGYWKVKL